MNRIVFATLVLIALGGCRSKRPAEPGPEAAPAPTVTGDPGPPSCRGGGPGAGRDCGAGTDCCASPAVPGGTFRRSFDGVNCRDEAHPATVSGFRMDTYEVTVGRFRAFLREGRGTARRPPVAGAGAHPRINGSGWDPAWSARLERDDAALRQALRCAPDTSTWTDEPGANERLPINCLTYYEAFAFCAWDGGRLPTEAEWNYVAAGGAEQRVYPWSRPPSSQEIDATHAVYGQSSVQAVGSKSPAGDGRWGQADLAGNVWTWTIDSADGKELLPTEGAAICNPAGYFQPCVDCARRAPGSARVLRGGGFGIPRQGVIASLRRGSAPTDRFHVFGVRCVREATGTQQAPEAQASPAPTAAACLPACEGKDCGADGCGGVCGACEGGRICDQTGHCPDPTYPPPPHAFQQGAVIPDFLLSGFPDPGRDSKTIQQIHLGDFHNPGGDESFPNGSVFGAGPKPRVLVVQFAAAWSAESRADAGRLGALDEGDRRRGGRVLLVLLDGERRGQNADAFNLITWVGDHEVRHPAMMDAENRVAPVVGDFPVSVVVDLRTQRIVALARGALPGAESPFWPAYEALLGPR